VQSLLLYLQDRPTAYLDEIAYFLFDSYSVDVSIKTVSRLLKEAEWSRKRAKKEAKQRNEELRAHWRAKRIY
jgi:transposase